MKRNCNFSIRKKLITGICMLGFLCFIAGIIYSFAIIYSHVKEITLTAKNDFGKDSLRSLMELVYSDNYSYKDKNTAIWAIGQFADETALPFLLELDEMTEEQDICDRESALCKREITKAVKWCKKGNTTSWMYRNIQ